MLTVQNAYPRETDLKQTLCAEIDGFGLHAAVRCDADHCKALEQLCRYLTRPVLANERAQCNAAGQVVLKLKTPWRAGTTHLAMTPLEFMLRLAVLVSPRRQLDHLLMTRRPRYRLLRGGQFRAVSVAEGSGTDSQSGELAACLPSFKDAPVCGCSPPTVLGKKREPATVCLEAAQSWQRNFAGAANRAP
jgi:hypothetical protein